MNNVTVLDNFYSEPQSVLRELKNEYPIFGCGTGKRSIGLQELNPVLYNNFCDSIFKVHNLNPNRLYVTTFFMEHNYNPIEVFNPGWVHIDGKNPDACRMTSNDYNLIVCGVVFLTENPDPECGMGVYELKKDRNWSQQKLIDECINDYTIPRELYEAGKIDVEEYAKRHREYHDNFELTCDVKNKFNRMVSWRGGSLHGQKMTKLMGNRVNQYFFVEYR